MRNSGDDKLSSYKEFRAQTKRRKLKRNLRRFGVVAILAALILGLAYIIVRIIEPKESTPITIPQIPDQITVQQNTQTETTEGWQATAGPIEQTINEWEIINPDYRMISLPENGVVDISYFDDATFVGDSLSQGIEIYSIFPNAKYCTYKGVSPKAMYDGTICSRADGTQEIPLDAIAATVPGKVYICMGTNGLVWMDDEALVAEYGNFIDALGTRVPGALIYVQSIPPVSPIATAARAQMNNERIRNVNNMLAKMAYEKGVYFVDIYESICDENGDLRADIAGSDGIHMRSAEGYAPWKQYLMTHVAHRAGNPYLLGSPYYVAPETVPQEEPVPESDAGQSEAA
ncbi:MAG: GDSL-type esterase/lipase family protein [Oscillospiraceae bacterium]|nr:GDSL-type esterase/lipase family protein [Oscillospiraceae bacterium]